MGYANNMSVANCKVSLSGNIGSEGTCVGGLAGYLHEVGEVDNCNVLSNANLYAAKEKVGHRNSKIEVITQEFSKAIE